MRWIAEMHRRGVIRALIIYVLAAWIVVEISASLLPSNETGAQQLRMIILVALVGCPVMAILVWRRGRGTGGGAKQAGERSLLSIVSVTALLAVLAWTVTAHSPRADREYSGIAILPFSDLSATEDHQYLADGIAEEIRNRLVAVPGLDVAARSSAFAFRQRSKNVREIGEILRVDLVLDGSLRKAGDTVRISLQLVDARTGFEVWTGSFDAGLDDIFALQDEIAAQIVAVVAPDNKETASVAAMPSSFDAYDLYLLGRHNWQKRDIASLERALEYFDQSISRDPRFAPSHTGRADSLLLLAKAGERPPQQAVVEANEAIQTALQLDPLLGDAHASLGLLRLFQGNFVAAELALREALRIAPENSTAHMWLGLTQLRRPGGGPNLALDALQAAQRLDPMDPTITLNLAGVLARLGHGEESISELRQLLARGVESHGAGVLLATLCLQWGRLDEAIVVLSDSDALTRGPDGRALYARTLAALGQGDLAATWLRSADLQETAAATPPRLDAAYITGADELLREALYRENPPHAAEWWNGLLSWRGGDISAALASFDLAAAAVPDGDPQLAITVAGARAAALRALGDADSAIGILMEARQLGADSVAAGWDTPQLNFALAVIEASLGDEAGATAYLEQAVAAGWRDIEWARGVPGTAQVVHIVGYAALEKTVLDDLQRQWKSVANQAEAATVGLSR